MSRVSSCWYAPRAIGVNWATWAESPCSAACIIRLNSRSKRSRGLRLLMSGARPGLLAPALAISGATGWGDALDTLYTMPPTSSRQSAPATIHARRSDGGMEGAPPLTGCPHRWQKRAWGDSSARQAAQARGVRLAPHELQKFPLPAVPQEGQVMAGKVSGKR